MKFVGYTEETKEQDRKEWIDKISVNYKNHFVKAYSGKARTSAVKAKCLDCSTYDSAEAGRCNITVCPLYEYNPYRRNLVRRKNQS